MTSGPLQTLLCLRDLRKSFLWNRSPIKCIPSIGWAATRRASLCVVNPLDEALKRKTEGRRKLAEVCSRPRGGPRGQGTKQAAQGCLRSGRGLYHIQPEAYTCAKDARL